ncbi:MAG: RNA polymerase sigma factor [Phycisphaerales bacterium]
MTRLQGMNEERDADADSGAACGTGAPGSGLPRLNSGASGDVAALVERAAGGDDAAWTELVRLFAPRIFAMARSRLGDRDAAEDIVQSVLATIAAKLSDRSPSVHSPRSSPASPGYEERGRFESWLFRITMNRVRDEARNRKHRATPTDLGSIGERADKSYILGLHSDGPDPQILSLRRAMEGLSDADREVVELRHHGQMAFKDIAELLSQPVGTVLARHHRALRKLRDMIGQPEDAPPDRE